MGKGRVNLRWPQLVRTEIDEASSSGAVQHLTGAVTFMSLVTRTRRSRSESHRGTALAEIAVCLPIIVLLAFASIEACTMIYLKQSLTIAAYEGGRTAVTPGATSADGRYTIELVECQGACANAPMMDVDGVYHEDLDQAKVDQILEELS